MALVALAVATIVGLKMVATPDAEDLYAVQERMETLHAPTPFLAGPTVGREAAAPTDRAPAAGPFPASPAAQIDWATRNGMPSLVLFHSTTCKACKIMEELIAEVRGDYDGEIVFVDVVVTDPANRTLLGQARIQAIPTTFFVDTTGRGSGVMGAIPEPKFRAELDRLAGRGG